MTANTTPPVRWQDGFSREPLWFIQCHIGASGDPLGRGRAPWWYPEDGVDWLISEIRCGAGFGARRILINRPGGDNGGDKPNAGASWLTMSPQRRGELTDKLADLMAQHPDIEIYWHVGSDQADPREFTSGLATRDHDAQGTEFYTLGDTSTAERINGTRATLGGWIGTGAAGLSLDYTSQRFKREHMFDLFEALRTGPFRFHIIGEAVPRFGSGRDWTPDWPALTRMPWITTMGNFAETFGDRPPSFDREQTRIIGWFAGAGKDYGDPHRRLALVQDAMERGMIVATCDEIMFSAALVKARLMGDIAP